ncbi:hypothetical protein BGX34_009262 [Mortierella sp. NVP85]|nr:hypothetical protein BGX34_009262 [Mortierella sp. NVP85]
MSEDQNLSERPKVLIVGAGIGGLTLGILLEKAGVPYEIVERAKEVKNLGSAMSLGSNVLYMFKQIGIYDEFVSRTKMLPGIDVYNENRQKEFVMDFKAGAEMGGLSSYIVARPVLHDLLMRQIPPEKLNIGKRVLSLEQGDNGVMIRCADGTEYHGDILIGADGANSAIRQSLYQQIDKLGRLPSSDNQPLPYSCVCLVGQTRPMDPAKFPQLNDPNCHFNSVIATDRPYSWTTFSMHDNTFCWGVVEYLNGETMKNHDNFRNSDWGPEAADVMCKTVASFPIPGSADGKWTLGDLFDNTPPHLISKVMLEEKVFDTWYYGRTALLGDACHKVHPAAGGGALNAMQDAIVLANWINTINTNELEDIEKVFKEYKNERYPVAKAAFVNGQMMAKLTARAKEDKGSIPPIYQASLHKTLKILRARAAANASATVL